VASDKPSVKRDTPAVKALQEGAFDTIYPEGEMINIDSDDVAGYIIRQGSIAVEMLLTAPDGLKKIELDNIEAGEYFNVHALFKLSSDNKVDLRYRTKCPTIIMRITSDMLPKDPQKLSAILASFMQTALRREDKLRQLTGYALQRAEEKKSDRKNGDTLFIQSLREEIDESDKRMKTIENTNAILRRSKQSLETELRSAKEALNFEIRTRQALEKRVSELTKLLATRDKTISQSKFPAASYLLESRELQDLEAHAKRFREAAEHFEDLAKKMHRAVELMAEDNPGMLLSNDVMMLLTGEEPPDRLSVIQAKASRENGSFRTLHFGSTDPSTVGLKSGNDNQTERIVSEKSRSEPLIKLSQTEMQSILEEFKNPSVAIPSVADSDNSTHQTSTDSNTWGVDDSSVTTPEPITQRITEPERMNTLVDGTRRATQISGKHLPVHDGYDTREPDSDITPVVPEYPDSAIQKAINKPIEFPDEGTDVRQIQEDWREKLKSKTPESEVDEPLSDIDWADSEDMRTTKAYQFSAPGKPSKPEP
jgi:hypothetical protein